MVSRRRLGPDPESLALARPHQPLRRPRLPRRRACANKRALLIEPSGEARIVRHAEGAAVRTARNDVELKATHSSTTARCAVETCGRCRSDGEVPVARGSRRHRRSTAGRMRSRRALASGVAERLGHERRSSPTSRPQSRAPCASSSTPSVQHPRDSPPAIGACDPASPVWPCRGGRGGPSRRRSTGVCRPRVRHPGRGRDPAGPQRPGSALGDGRAPVREVRVRLRRARDARSRSPDAPALDIVTRPGRRGLLQRTP